METEYIEKQVAIKELCETYEHEYPTASGAFDEYATRIVPNVLRNLPPADVRPVVTCRDCFHRREADGWCAAIRQYIDNLDYFCADGVRKNDVL